MLGIVLDPKSRATNVARTLGMIDAAAASDPAPDLIVVPAGCDRICRPGQVQAPAMPETYWASLSAKAREWGVYLTVGQERPRNGRFRNVAVVVDADGDEILVHSTNREGTRVSVRQTLIGVLGVCFESQCVGAGPAITVEGPGPQAIIALGEPKDGPEASSTAVDACGRLAAETSSFVCLVRPADGSGDDNCVTCSDTSCLDGREELAAGVVVTAVVPEGG